MSNAFIFRHGQVYIRTFCLKLYDIFPKAMGVFGSNKIISNGDIFYFQSEVMCKQ